MNFSYKEFSDDGALLDREDGALPGVIARVSRRYVGYALAGSISGYSGDVGYNGETNTGTPVTTRSGADMFDMHLRAELGPLYFWPPDSRLYFGVGYSRWRRDIRSTTTSSGTPVRGLLEIYEWWRGLLGADITIRNRTNTRWSVDAQIFRTWDPTVAVDFNGAFDRATLRLGQSWGARLTLQWLRRLSAQTGVTVESYIEAWEYGRSATQPLTRGGTVVGTVHEPRSETRNVGIAVSLSMRF